MRHARSAFTASGLVVHGILGVLVVCTLTHVQRAAATPTAPNATAAPPTSTGVWATTSVGVAPSTTMAVSTAAVTPPPTPAASSGPNCPSVDGIDVYRFSACGGYRECLDTFATCVGGEQRGTLDSVAATAPLSLSCDSLTRCATSYIQCLDRLATAARSNAQHACYSWAGTSYVEMLRTSATTYAGSPQEASCQRAMCVAANATGRTALTVAGGCRLAPTADNPPYSAVCAFREPDRRVLARGQVWFQGRAWGAIAANATTAERATTAAAADIATQLNLRAEFIEVAPPVLDAATNASASISFTALEGTPGASSATVLASAQGTESNPADAATWMPQIAAATAAERAEEPLRVARFVAGDGVSAMPQGYDYVLQIGGNWAQWRIVGRGVLFSEEAAVIAAVVADLAALLAIDVATIRVVEAPLVCGLVLRVGISRTAGIPHSTVLERLQAARGDEQRQWLARTAVVHDSVFATSPRRTGPLEPVSLAAVQAALALSTLPRDVSDAATCATAESLGLTPPPTTSAPPRWQYDPGIAMPTPAPSAAIARGPPMRRVLFAAAAAAVAASFSGFGG